MTAAGMGAQAEKGKRPGGGTILDRLTDHARERVEEAKRRQPLAEIRQRASDMPKGNFVKKIGHRLYLRVQKGVSVQRADRAGVPLSFDRPGI